jgi:hypothetical protein
MCGVTPQAINKAIKGVLEPALVGGRIDLDHENAVEYLNRTDRGSVKQSGKPADYVRGHAAKKNKEKAESLKSMAEDPADGKIHEVPADIEAFADMTLRELIERFGTETAFCDWLKATKEIESINEKRLKNAQTMGDLVSRDLIKVGIIEPIDSAHIKLLTDGAKTISVRAIALHEAGKSSGEIEKFVSEQMTSFIRPVKSKVSRIMRKIDQ